MKKTLWLNLQISLLLTLVVGLLTVNSYGQVTVNPACLWVDEKGKCIDAPKNETYVPPKADAPKTDTNNSGNNNNSNTDTRKCVVTGKDKDGIKIVECPPGCDVSAFTTTGEIITKCEGGSLRRPKSSQQTNLSSIELARQGRESYERWEKDGFDFDTKVRSITPSYNEAIAYFRQAIEKEPDNAKWHSQLAIVLSWQIFGSDGENAGWASANRDAETKKRFLEAARELKEAIRLEPKNLNRYGSLGYVLSIIAEDFNEPYVYKEIRAFS